MAKYHEKLLAMKAMLVEFQRHKGVFKWCRIMPLDSQEWSNHIFKNLLLSESRRPDTV